jgi:EmrB/QacA subfamily drug resistance transporter
MERKWWTLVAVVMGVFMLLLDVTIVSVALPEIQKAFKAPLSDLQWVLDAYALTLAAVLLTAGSLADRWGRRTLYTIGTTIFTLGSLLCGLATGPLFLSLARAGQGIGGAVMFATSLALLSDAFRGKERGIAFGVFGMVTGVAVAVGPVLGGVIINALSWRWIFLVNIPIGIFTAAVTLAKVAESRDPDAARTDWLGFLTFSGGLTALIYGLISSSDGWGATKVVASLVAAGVLLAVFLVLELVQRQPMLDLKLFAKPTFSGGLIAAFGISASLFALLNYLVIYLHNALGYSALGVGARTLFLTLAIFVTAGIAGRLTTVVPVRAMISTGFVLVATGLFLMRGITATSSWTHLIPGLIIAGVGAGLINVPLASTAVGVVPTARAGMASGINSTLRQVGLATGVAVLGSIFTARMQSVLPQSQSLTTPSVLRAGFASGMNRILLIGAVVALVSAVGSLLLIRGRDFVTEEAVVAEPRMPVPEGSPS